MRPRSTLTSLLVAVGLLCSCSGGAPGAAGATGATATTPVVHATTASPGPLTVVGDADPVAAAIGASRALFRTSPVVVVARSGDEAGTLLGASAAVALGVPLLLQPETPSGDALVGELDRLRASTVLAVGPVDATALHDGREPAVLAAATPQALRRAGVPLAASRSVPREEVARAVAALGPQDTPALQPAAGGDPPAASSAPSSTASSAPSGTAGAPARLPRMTRGDAPDSTLVLATGDAASVAGLATARAAGAQVQLTGGTADPRASTDAIAALSRTRPQAVVALGSAFAGDDGLGWKLATAATGRQLPGGGQLLFPGRTLVALYGTPGTAALGVLGEQDLPAAIQRAKDTAGRYRPLIPGPVVPTFEIIATVASSAPGPDGNYSTEIPPDRLRPWVEAAEKAGMYVILDLQPGRSDLLAQARLYRTLLEQPNVGLALDPEWRLRPGQLPLQQIGSVDVDEINRVITWLADLTREAQLPQKLLVLHQFRLSMIPGRDRLDTSRPELAITVHADGQGAQPTKQATWQTLHRDLPRGPLFWGWKNFYDEDHPMLTPEQTVAQVHPTPNLISYQ